MLLETQSFAFYYARCKPRMPLSSRKPRMPLSFGTTLVESVLVVELLMPAKNTKCTNIWKILTPLDPTHLEIFLRIFLMFSNFFNSNLRTHQILHRTDFFVPGTVPVKPVRFTAPTVR
jgi:hypothetical protein